MNNLIFNTTASELKSSIYGYNQSSLTLQLLQLDSAGNMLMTGSVTVNNAITIANATLTVDGSVTVNNAITIANTTLTVLISGQTFTSATANLPNVTGTGNVFTATNISTLTTASMFINNTGSNTVTYSLMLSPDGTTYFADPNYTSKTVIGGGKAVIPIDIFAQYVQLQYELGTNTATFSAYYNGQA
ncbi:DUF6385 domain-containing protein [Anaerotignum sp.]|uniref:DUF6385 domain-containing protein n=1 Tax=Anaerotignum sp. TaxID=2039241 RepID=UPI003317AC0F